MFVKIHLKLKAASTRTVFDCSVWILSCFNFGSKHKFYFVLADLSWADLSHTVFTNFNLVAYLQIELLDTRILVVWLYNMFKCTVQFQKRTFINQIQNPNRNACKAWIWDEKLKNNEEHLNTSYIEILMIHVPYRYRINHARFSF